MFLLRAVLVGAAVSRSSPHRSENAKIRPDMIFGKGQHLSAGKRPFLTRGSSGGFQPGPIPLQQLVELAHRIAIGQTFQHVSEIGERLDVVELGGRDEGTNRCPARSSAVGLISYGPDFVDQYRGAAAYVDRILKGEKSSDLPVQAPTKFHFIINLKTARALGFNLSPTFVGTADEVIE